MSIPVGGDPDLELEAGSDRCWRCGGTVVFDNWRDVNICILCGAHERTAGCKGSRIDGETFANRDGRKLH